MEFWFFTRHQITSITRTKPDDSSNSLCNAHHLLSSHGLKMINSGDSIIASGAYFQFRSVEWKTINDYSGVGCSSNSLYAADVLRWNYNTSSHCPQTQFCTASISRMQRDEFYCQLLKIQYSFNYPIVFDWMEIVDVNTVLQPFLLMPKL